MSALADRLRLRADGSTKTTAVHAAALFAAGAVGGAGVGLLVLQWQRRSGVEWTPLLLASGAASAVVVLSLRRFLLRNGRRGAAWGSVAGAFGPVCLTAVVAVAAVATGAAPTAATLYDAALFQLFVLPLTVALAVTSGLLSARQTATD